MAIAELGKGEKDNPLLAEINYIVAVCYKNLDQNDKYLRELKVAASKKGKR